MKKTLKKFTPSPAKLQQYKHLSWLSGQNHRQSLWNFNRKSIAKAFAIGLFCAFLPIPFQMLPAAIAAVFFGANLPVSVALVWITNPLTMAPIFYVIYQFGAWILGVSMQTNFSISWEYISAASATVFPSLLIGSLIVATISALLGYWSIQIIYRFKAYKRSRNK